MTGSKNQTRLFYFNAVDSRSLPDMSPDEMIRLIIVIDCGQFH